MKLTFALVFCVIAAAAAFNPAFGQETRCYNCKMNPNGCWSCPGEDTSGGTSCSNVSCAGCTVNGSCGAGSGCFTGAIMISTPSGLVAIRDLRVGDVVVSMDKDGKTVPATVTDTHLSESWSFLLINEDLEVTDTHPFLVNGEWKVAGEILVGDKLLRENSTEIVVRSISRIDKGVRVYNISVDNINTFYASGYYVHNKPPIPGT